MHPHCLNFVLFLSSQFGFQFSEVGIAPTTAAFKITEGGNVICTLEFEVEDIFPVEEQLKYN